MIETLMPGKTENEIAAVAYAAVAGVPTLEPNDRNRLGFHIYLYLTGNIDSVLDAVREARARMPISSADAAATITAALQSAGVQAA